MVAPVAKEEESQHKSHQETTQIKLESDNKPSQTVEAKVAECDEPTAAVESGMAADSELKGHCATMAAAAAESSAQGKGDTKSPSWADDDDEADELEEHCATMTPAHNSLGGGGSRVREKETPGETGSLCH